MTIIGPLLFAAFIILPAWLSQVEDNRVKIIAVVEADEFNNPLPDSLRFVNMIPNKKNLKFEYVRAPLEALKKSLSISKYDAILYIPYDVINSQMVELFSKKQPSPGMEEHITSSLDKDIYTQKLSKYHISQDVLRSVRTDITLRNIILEKDGSYKVQSQQDVKRWIGYICGFLIYFFIFFFGAQVMRGVIEEKSSRIVEVIVSSVRPFQLMLGKIIGIGLVGLTQFFIWIVLTLSIVLVLQQATGLNRSLPAASELKPENLFEAGHIQSQQPGSDKTAEFKGYLESLHEIPFLKILTVFLFYFTGGFILYGSLFAAIGAAVDSETDTQQFMLPVTIPLALSFVIMIGAFSNPEGQLAVIFSIIPLTSPVVMMGRMGFDIPAVQIIASMLLLILTFLFTIWLAGKIYRTGILMYGKKITYKELWKWLRYRN